MTTVPSMTFDEWLKQKGPAVDAVVDVTARLFSERYTVDEIKHTLMEILERKYFDEQARLQETAQEVS